MESTKIELLIYELLFEQDCVIIPSLGGFICHQQSAKIDFSSKEILPPRKTVSFNTQLNKSDGILIDRISRDQQISFSEAQKIVSTYIESVNQILHEYQIKRIEGIGQLCLNSESKLIFTPEEKSNFNSFTQYFHALDCQPIIRDKEYIKDKIDTEAAKVMKIRKKKTPVNWSRRISVAAAAAAVILLSIVGIKEWSKESTNNSAAITQREEIQEEKNIQPQEASILAPIITSTQDSVKEETTVPQKEVEPIEEKVAEKIINPEVKEYLIVIGSFGKKKNAEKLAKRLESSGYLPDLEPKGKLHRVGVRIICSKDKIQEHLEDVKKTYNKKAWLVK